MENNMKSKSEVAEGYLVFISHSVKDRWIARQIANLIEQKGKRYGVKTFLDEKDIFGGDSIPEVIRKNIQSCDELIVLLSNYSIDRPWVLVEIGAAWGHDKRVVPIIDKIALEEIPNVIKQCKAIDLNDFDKYLDELIARVKGGRK
jgi:hypothetical protein